jgi:hypothetical protein
MPPMPEQTAEITITAPRMSLTLRPGIFRRLAIAPDHVDVTAEARVGQHQVPAEQHDGGDDDDPWDPADRAGAERRDQLGTL